MSFGTAVARLASAKRSLRCRAASPRQQSPPSRTEKGPRMSDLVLRLARDLGIRLAVEAP